MSKDPAPLQAPANSMIGIFATEADKTALEAALNEARYFSASHVEVFYGEEALERIDPDGTHHGGLTRIWRVVQKMISETDHVTLAAIEKALKNNQYVVAVHTDGSEAQQDEVKQIMVDNNGDKIFFAGPVYIELLVGW